MLKRELNKKQIIIVSFVSLLLVVSAVAADMLLKSAPAKPGDRTATASEAATPQTAERSSYQYAQISSKLTEIVEDKPYEPSPDVLNLAYFYPEGADTDDVINSYAGRLYTELTTKEAQYMADIYDMSDRMPLNMAKQLGLPTSRVLGKYNPNDPSHDADNPATWTVNSFKNANVAFYDGDGNRINAYSAVKEIMAMASVYSYYHGIHDYETMRDYALKLWEHSHSYTISMGNVYYDSGCLNKTVQQEAEEAIEQEKQQQLLEESLAKRTAVSSGGQPVNYETTAGPANDITETTPNDEATLFYNLEEGETSGENAAEAAPQAENSKISETGASLFSVNGTSESKNSSVNSTGDAASGTSAAAASENASSAQTSSDNSSGNSAGTQGAGGTETAGNAAPQAAKPSEQTTAASAANAADTNANASEKNTSATNSAGSASYSQKNDEATFAAFSKTAGMQGLSYRGVALADNQEATFFSGGEAAQPAQSEAAPAAQPTAGQTAAAEPSQAGTQAETKRSGAGAAQSMTPETVPSEAQGTGQQGGSAQTASQQTASQESAAQGAGSQEATMANAGNEAKTLTRSYCPGHVDLYITVTIYGIDDANGLMKFDTIGNDEANFNDEWKGWTDEAKASARALNAEDWFKRYGLTISAINVRNPLTESEIDAYLARIPDTVSQQRKDVVSFALHSVGKVPYYWGGKPSAPRYEQNNYGTLVAPDTKGRVLRGLDCSGWVNWVYWSAFGQRLAGESTGTLIGCGERISRSELQPGDIIVRTGADAHVVMFLEWAGNGNMIVVHETGGVTNNVTVSEISANWPYYRKLIQ